MDMECLELMFCITAWCWRLWVALERRLCISLSINNDRKISRLEATSYEYFLLVVKLLIRNASVDEDLLTCGLRRASLTISLHNAQSNARPASNTEWKFI